MVGSADGILDATLNNFFGSVGGNTNGTTDPRVRYDRVSGRWFVTAIDTPTVDNNILIAVSSGPNSHRSRLIARSSYSLAKIIPA